MTKASAAHKFDDAAGLISNIGMYVLTLCQKGAILAASCLLVLLGDLFWYWAVGHCLASSTAGWLNIRLQAECLLLMPCKKR